MEVGLSTFQPIIAPILSEAPEGTQLAPPPIMNPLEPRDFLEEFHSIAMSRAQGGMGHVGHCNATLGVPDVQEVDVTSRLDQAAINAAHVVGY